MARRASREALGLTDKHAETGADLLTPVEKLAETYRRAFSDGPGADVLADLKKRFGTRRSFVADSNTTAFYEGQRDVYLMILSHIERDVNRNPNQESTD